MSHIPHPTRSQTRMLAAAADVRRTLRLFGANDHYSRLGAKARALGWINAVRALRSLQ